MAVQFVLVKCPKCNADLNIEEDRNTAFCTYCGAKIIMSNDNEHIIRQIDDARIKEAETDRIVRLHQLEMEEKAASSSKLGFIVWLLIVVLLIAGGIVGLAIDNLGLGVPCLVFGFATGLYGCIFLGIKSIITSVKKNRQAGEIKYRIDHMR